MIPKISTDIAFAENLSKFRLNLGTAIINNNQKLINNNIEEPLADSKKNPQFKLNINFKKS